MMNFSRWQLTGTVQSRSLRKQSQGQDKSQELKQLRERLQGHQSEHACGQVLNERCPRMHWQDWKNGIFNLLDHQFDLRILADDAESRMPEVHHLHLARLRTVRVERIPDGPVGGTRIIPEVDQNRHSQPHKHSCLHWWSVGPHQRSQQALGDFGTTLYQTPLQAQGASAGGGSDNEGKQDWAPFLSHKEKDLVHPNHKLLIQFIIILCSLPAILTDNIKSKLDFHLVFEEIGLMTSSTDYQLATMKVNLTLLENTLFAFKDTVIVQQKFIERMPKPIYRRNKLLIHERVNSQTKEKLLANT